MPSGRERQYLSDTLPEQREWCSADILIGGNYYEEIVSDKKTPIGDSGLYLRSSKLGEILTGAQEPKELPVGCAYYPREPEYPIGYFSCSHATKTELTKEIQGKAQPIGSRWNMGTEYESMNGHWKRAVRRTPKEGFRQEFPSPRKGENRKAPKLKEKRIMDVIPSSGLDTVCGARKKKGREKTSFQEEETTWTMERKKEEK